MGIRRLATVSEVVSNGQWSFNRCRNPTICSTIQAILTIQPPLPSAGPDEILWRHDENTYKNNFSSKKTWSQIYLAKPKVSWHRAVWFGSNIPRHAFISWLAIRNRLPTGDRAGKWGQDPDCKLCGERLETRSHLFFACPFSFTVWNSLVDKLLRRTDPDWNSTLIAISGRRNKATDTLLVRLLFQASIYHIWRERNSRRHTTNKVSATFIVTTIQRELGNRLLALTTENSQAMRDRWNEIMGVN